MNHNNFSTFPLKPEILKNLESLDYKQMTPIQMQSLGPILENKDIIGLARTGSGKTAAFGLGLIEKMTQGKHSVQSLVLCPTRELAEQVAKEIRRLARQLPNIKVLTLCGGTPMGPQIASLEHGAHCIVGTPGRIKDHLDRKTLRLKQIQTLVLDEADRMLDMGFSEIIDSIVSASSSYRQTLLFSATYPQNIIEMSKKFQKKPIFVKAAESPQEKAKILETFYQTEEAKKTSLLIKLLMQHQAESTVIFCNTKQKCAELSFELKKKGFYAQAIHGDLEQYERNQVLTLFANRSSSILVATDVAARGIDINDLKSVINFDLPRDPHVYTHRIGRTGRAGKTGLAISLVAPSDTGKLKSIEKMQDRQILVQNSQSNMTSSPTPSKPFLPPMGSLQINGGKKHKVRATDILGALTKEGGLEGKAVGKINIFEFHSIIAISRKSYKKAFTELSHGKIKGRTFKVKEVTPV